jgi:maltose alpha-D-glucosyltransferase/alpha-amylase
MQWDDTPGAGFSTADPDAFYLPLDPAPDRPSVAAQQSDADSLLHQVRALIELRRTTPALGSQGSVRVLHDGYPFVCTRGDEHGAQFLVVVNPRRDPALFDVSEVLAGDPSPVLARGVAIAGGTATAQGFSYGIFAL